MKKCLLTLLLVSLAVLTVAQAERLAPELKRDRRLINADLPETVLIRNAAAWLLAQAKTSDKGTTWTEYAEYPFTTLSLYSGTPGIIHTLVSLYNVTGDNHYEEVARSAIKAVMGEVLRSDTEVYWMFAWDDAEEKVHFRRSSGYYEGTTGVALALLEAGTQLDIPEASKLGIEALLSVAANAKPDKNGATWDYGAYDIISGGAGVLCAMLRGYELSGEKALLDCAAAIGERLLACATRNGERWSWSSGPSATKKYNGFAHGTAGVAWALARLAVFTGENKYLTAAICGAVKLDAEKIAGKLTVGWPQEEGGGKDAPLREGWCHGTAGTARLFLLLHGITDDASYLETARYAADRLLESYHPKHDRSRAGFWSPSYCCGAAAVGDFMIDMYRFTGEAKYLEFASDTANWLSRIGDRTQQGGVCWNLTPRPDPKHGVMHPTSLMLGAGGQLMFLARLAALKSGVVYPVLLTADRIGLSGPAGKRLVVVKFGAGAEKFSRAARMLAQYRNCDLVAIPDGNVDVLRSVVRRTMADAVAIFVAPEVLDINLNRRVLDALCSIDHDIFCDAALGYFTAMDEQDIIDMLESMARVEADGIILRAANVSVASNLVKLLRMAPAPHHTALGAKTGIMFERVYLTCVEKNPDCRADLPSVIPSLAGSGLVTFFGCGDPVKTWLFSDRRNIDTTKHWPYDADKVVTDPAYAEMPGVGASDYRNLDLSPAVVATGVCHHGVPLNAAVDGDIVSTFGDTDGYTRFYRLKPKESICLNILARGPSAFLAPIGANHGNMAELEIYRAMSRGISLGEAVRMGLNDAAFAMARRGSLPFSNKSERMKPDEIRNLTGFRGGVMIENSLNRVLYGDPTFSPFDKVSPRKAALGVTVLRSDENESVWQVTVDDSASPEYWDMFHGDGPMRERIAIALDLEFDRRPAEFKAECRFENGRLALTSGEWAIERTCIGQTILHAQVNAPGLQDYKKNLWRGGVQVFFSAKWGGGGMNGEIKVQ